MIWRSSSFCFGILFLLKATLAQSAPHSASYPDEDEEALIDKLASYAAAVGPDAFLSTAGAKQISRQQQSLSEEPYLPQNYDLASYLAAAAAGAGGSSGVTGGGGVLGAGDWGAAQEALLAREAALKLPRQFGYKPTDLRFFLPADQFPPQETSQQQQQLPLLQEDEERGARAPFEQQREESPRLSMPPPQEPPGGETSPERGKVEAPPPPLTPDHPGERLGQNEFVLGEDKSDFYFMKKKEQLSDGGAAGGNGGGGGTGFSMGRNYVPRPNNIMASEHAAPYPGYAAASPVEKSFTYSDMYYIAIVAGCSAAAVVGIIAAGICYYRIHERIKAAADVDYPAYGVTGPSKDITPSGGGDRKLAQSAQMYHYQHQKQQMAALQKGAIQGDRQGSGGSDVESDDDNEDGDYTVYECPGLAPAGEMEVKNPLFHDEQAGTPGTPGANGSHKAERHHHHHQRDSPSSTTTTSSTTKTVTDDSSSPAPDDTASSTSSASSTATITSTTPKITPQSPKTPPTAATAAAAQQQPPPAEQQPATPAPKGKEGKGKGEKK